MFSMLEYASGLVAMLVDLSSFLVQTSFSIPLYDFISGSWVTFSFSLPFGLTIAELLIGSGLTYVLGVRVVKFIYA